MSASGTPEARPPKRVVVAGHVCLDLIPSFEATGEGARLEPGSLLEVGAATLAPAAGSPTSAGRSSSWGSPRGLSARSATTPSADF